MTGDRPARSLGEPSVGFRLLHHYFVTDPSGWSSPFPECSRPLDVDPAVLLCAAEAACRFVPNHTAEHTRLRLFFGVGRRTRLGIDTLRSVLPSCRTTAFRRAVTVTTEEISATLLCLGDSRLMYRPGPARKLPSTVAREAG